MPLGRSSERAGAIELAYAVEAARMGRAVPSFWEKIPIAWRQETATGAFLTTDRVPGERDPGFDPLEMNDNGEFRHFEDETMMRALMQAGSLEQLRAMEANIRRTREDLRMLASGGIWEALAATMIAGMASFENYIPFGYVGKSVRLSRRWRRLSALRRTHTVARRQAIGTLAANALAEAGIQANRYERPWEASAINLAASLPLGYGIGAGLAGGGIVASKALRRMKLEAERMQEGDNRSFAAAVNRRATQIAVAVRALMKRHGADDAKGAEPKVEAAEATLLGQSEGAADGLKQVARPPTKATPDKPTDDGLEAIIRGDADGDLSEAASKVVDEAERIEAQEIAAKKRTTETELKRLAAGVKKESEKPGIYIALKAEQNKGKLSGEDASELEAVLSKYEKARTPASLSKAVKEMERVGENYGLAAPRRAPPKEPAVYAEVENGTAATLPVDDAQIQNLSATAIKAKPTKYQYRPNADRATGETGRLKEVKRFDQLAAGILTVLKEKDGSYVVIDGHQRLGLAKRLIAEGNEKEVMMAVRVLEESAELTPDKAFAIGTMINFHNLGEAADVKDIFDVSAGIRDSKTWPQEIINQLNRTYKDGSQKARYLLGGLALDKQIYEAYRNHTNLIDPGATLPPSHVLLIGVVAPDDPVLQKAIYNTAIREVSTYRTLTPAEALNAYQILKSFGSVKPGRNRQQTFFSEDTPEILNAVTMGKMVIATQKSLAKNKNLLNDVSGDLDFLNSLGKTKIDKRAALDQTNVYNHVIAYIDAQATAKGTALSSLLSGLARQVNEGTVSFGDGVIKFRRSIEGTLKRRELAGGRTDGETKSDVAADSPPPARESTDVGGRPAGPPRPGQEAGARPEVKDKPATAQDAEPGDLKEQKEAEARAEAEAREWLLGRPDPSNEVPDANSPNLLRNKLPPGSTAGSMEIGQSIRWRMTTPFIHPWVKIPRNLIKAFANLVEKNLGFRIPNFNQVVSPILRLMKSPSLVVREIGTHLFNNPIISELTQRQGAALDVPAERLLAAFYGKYYGPQMRWLQQAYRRYLEAEGYVSTDADTPLGGAARLTEQAIGAVKRKIKPGTGKAPLTRDEFNEQVELVMVRRQDGVEKVDDVHPQAVEAAKKIQESLSQFWEKVLKGILIDPNAPDRTYSPIRFNHDAIAADGGVAFTEKATRAFAELNAQKFEIIEELREISHRLRAEFGSPNETAGPKPQEYYRILKEEVFSRMVRLGGGQFEDVKGAWRALERAKGQVRRLRGEQFSGRVRTLVVKNLAGKRVVEGIARRQGDAGMTIDEIQDQVIAALIDQNPATLNALKSRYPLGELWDDLISARDVRASQVYKKVADGERAARPTAKQAEAIKRQTRRHYEAVRAILQRIDENDFDYLKDPNVARRMAERMRDRILGIGEPRSAQQEALERLGRGTNVHALTNHRAGLPSFLQYRQADLRWSDFVEFLNLNAEETLTIYNTNVAPLVALKRTFGTTEVDEIVKAIKKDYQQLIQDASTPNEKAKLLRRQRSDIEDVEDAFRIFKRQHDRGVQEGTLRWIDFFTGLARLDKLGWVAVTSITDIARFVRYGWLMKSVKYALTGPDSKFSVTREEAAKLALLIEDIANATPGLAASTPMTAGTSVRAPTYAGKLNRAERVVQSAQRHFGELTLLGRWNQYLKGLAARAMVEEVLAAGKVARSDSGWAKLSKHKKTLLAMNHLDRDMLARIYNEAHAHRGGGQLNVDKWIDTEAADRFQLSLNAVANNLILTPGAGSTPFWTKMPFGRVLSQFKSFSFIAHLNTMWVGALQQPNRYAPEVAMGMVLGAVNYYLKAKARGREVSDDWRVWVSEAADRSGAFGLFTEVNAWSGRMTRGDWTLQNLLGADDKELSRWAGRPDMSFLLGPSGGVLNDALRTMRIIAPGVEIQEGDVRALRRLIIFNNLFYLDPLFTKMETAATEAWAD